MYYVVFGHGLLSCSRIRVFGITISPELRVTKLIAHRYSILHTTVLVMYNLGHTP